MKKKLLSISVVAVASVFLWSCQREAKLWKPTPPIPGLEIVPQEYSINPTADTLLVTPGGTTLFIPANCFVRVDGKEMEGEITVTYREFHDAIDIMLAGIHMDFYSMGERRIFTTAGMFEIDAHNGDNKVTFAEDKEIDIRFASQYQGDDYSFFYLNPETGAWEWVDLPEPAEVNVEKVEALKELQKKIPKNYLGPDHFVLDYMSFLDIYFNNNWRAINDNKESKAIRQKLEAYNARIYNINLSGDIKFLNGYYKPAELLWKHLDNKPFPKWAEKIVPKWEKVNDKWVDKNCKFKPLGYNLYELTLEHDGKVFTKRMEAVLPLKNLLKLKPEQWQAQYDEAIELVLEEQARVDVMAETFRVFSINQLGIFNFDGLMKMKDWFRAVPTFTLAEEEFVQGDVMIIFGDNSGYAKLGQNELESWFRINPETKPRILMVNSSRELFYYPIQNYSNWDTKTLRATQLPEVTFEMERKIVESVDELRTYLGFK
ncbi:MAG TPA: hypothetical protein PK287_02560 [Tenuifilaceae bacterium]|nr:hypothetical protein [Tenuifilaceae bacterium]HOQ34104.1 hypothetical protein [Tenuifilaceae bacterium]HPK76453.1 hypothetical protein [Tenuifilaceae bacterium]